MGHVSSFITILAVLGHVEGVRYLGRVNPATKELTWPSSGVSFAFTGTSATIELAAVSGNNGVALIVDGGAPMVIKNVQGTSISTPAGLSAGKHTVALRKRSEAWMGSMRIGNITTDGTLQSDDELPKRRLEIIGDSISVGYGLDGVYPCTNDAAVENNLKTYGAVAADVLGADYSVVAWSGKGLIRNTPGDTGGPIMPQLYTRYGANDADNSYNFPSSTAPDAVVINLGTNDFNYLNARDPLNATAFAAAMANFIRSIQSHYPKAEFFLVTSPMLSDTYPTAADAQKTTQRNALNNAIAQVKGTRVHLVDWPTQGSDVGCDYHPNAATHAAGAKVLVASIRAAMNW